MPQNKKQHYVPRFYLARFSGNGKHINIWNLQRKKNFHSAKLRNQCYRNYFYGKQLDVEKALGNVEGEMAKILNNLDKRKVLPRTGSPERLFIVLYVLIQYYRTVYLAQSLDEMNDRMTKHLFGTTAKAAGIDLDQFTIGFKDVPRYALAHTVESYPLLLDLHFKLLINRTGVEFVTSDNPVVLYNQLFYFRKSGSNTGLAQKGLQVFLPLDPNRVLLIYDASVYAVGKRTRDIVNIDVLKDILEINTLQMCSASSNVYFRDSQLDIESLHENAARFRRARKSSLDAFHGEETEDRKQELVQISREDIRTDLNLSILRLTRNARRWRKRFLNQKVQPVFVPRDRALFDDHHEFLQKVDNGEYAPSDFFEFLEAKYSGSKANAFHHS